MNRDIARDALIFASLYYGIKAFFGILMLTPQLLIFAFYIVQVTSILIYNATVEVLNLGINIYNKYLVK